MIPDSISKNFFISHSNIFSSVMLRSRLKESFEFIQAYRMETFDYINDDEFIKRLLVVYGRRKAWQETILTALCDTFGGAWYFEGGRMGGTRKKSLAGSKGIMRYYVCAMSEDSKIIEKTFKQILTHVSHDVKNVVSNIPRSSKLSYEFRQAYANDVLIAAKNISNIKLTKLRNRTYKAQCMLKKAGHKTASEHPIEFYKEKQAKFRRILTRTIEEKNVIYNNDSRFMIQVKPRDSKAYVYRTLMNVKNVNKALHYYNECNAKWKRFVVVSP